jgi:Serine aminopeptidase, S33
LREKIYTFGPSGSIVGILTEPDPAVARSGAPVIIASNVGLNHRIGPFRAYVCLARDLAKVGYSMLRFDLSGMGDSELRLDNHGELERAVLDVKDAMQALTDRYGARTFVQLGFCSGVDSAHAVAIEDPRVVGAIFIEGYSFPTPQFYARRYLKRPWSRRLWRRYWLQTLARYFPAARSHIREAGEAVEIYSRSYPTREQLARDFTAMAARGVGMLFVYTGGHGSDHARNYAGQFFDAFHTLRGEPRIEVEYFETADHIFTVLADREKLLARIKRWMQAHFP